MRREGLPLAELHREPGRARLPELPRRLLGPGVEGVLSTPARCCRSTSARRAGSSIPAVDSPPDVMITLQPMNIQSAAADLLWSRVLKNYPDLRIALSEGGTGWIPYFLDRVDRTYEMHHAWTLQDFGGRLPSEVFREHFLTCFISDPVGVELREQIGIDNIAWEADYPHSDSMWPTAPEELAAVFEANDVPDDEIRKMTHENAMRWYSFDPFAHVPKERGHRRRAARARPRATTCRSCPAAPGCARPTRSSRASASGQRRAVAAIEPRTRDAEDERGRTDGCNRRQMSLVGLHAGRQRHRVRRVVAPSRHRARLPRPRLLPEARPHPRRGLLRPDVLRRPPGHARHLRRLGRRGGAPRRPSGEARPEHRARRRSPAPPSSIGLGATYSTTYYSPFHVARTFATLDHLSGGRAAWNVVTSVNDSEAQNFGVDGAPRPRRALRPRRRVPRGDHRPVGHVGGRRARPRPRRRRASPTPTRSTSSTTTASGSRCAARSPCPGRRRAGRCCCRPVRRAGAATSRRAGPS